MGKKWKHCSKCPEKTPNYGHSDFSWIKTTKDIASGDWKQTYEDLPIDWPKPKPPKK
jgi:hypothetical protein